MNQDHDFSGKQKAQVTLASGRGEPKVINAFKDSQELAASSVTEFNLSQLAQHREQTHLQVAKAVEELERLRGHREELERERMRLEALEQRQNRFEQEQTGLRDSLAHHMELLRKMDIEASRRAELFAAVRRRFEEMLREVERLRDQTWDEARYDEELNRALAILEDIQREYNRAWSRVEAVTGEAAVSREFIAAQTISAGPSASAVSPARGFLDWLWIGLAVSLPLIMALIGLFAVSRWLWGGIF